MNAEQPGEFDPSTYQQWRSSELGRTTDRLERELIFDLVGNVAGLTVLDLGCGDGELAVELCRRGATVVGVDASPRMIEAAAERAHEESADIDFQVATAHALPFPPDAFDAVVSITMLCFIEDVAPVLREMARVLRPGGRLIIGELGKWSTWAAKRRVRAWLGSPLWHSARFRTGAELQALAETAGLDVQQLKGAIYYPPCHFAARLLEPLDRRLGRLGMPGPAFLALAATKPSK
jgi:ubiquinone biosynthesis O-methyltransferase